MKNKRKLSWLLLFTMLFGLIFVMDKEVLAATANKQIKVNSTILEFGEIIYVDGANGDDAIGTGSKVKPFKTIIKGFDYLNDNYRQGGAIIIKDGNYDVGGLFNTTNLNLYDKYNSMKVSLIAETMGKVEFTNTKDLMVIENSSTSRIKLSFYGINFLTGPGNLGGDDWTNEFYNCVFNHYGGWNSVVTNANAKFENCLFTGTPNGTYKTNPLGGTAVNCASTTADMDPYSGTKTTSLYSVTIDTEFNITSNGWKNTGTGKNPDGTTANIGVYGGQFSWGSKVEEIGENVLKLVLEKNEVKQLSVSEELSDNTNFTWVSSNPAVATVDANGKVKALKPGDTVITCTSADGEYTDKINVLVVDLNYQLAVDLLIGEKCRLTVDDLKDTAKVTWAVNDPSIATVSNKGRVTAVSEGLTFVTATDETGKIIGQIYIRVRQ